MASQADTTSTPASANPPAPISLTEKGEAYVAAHDQSANLHVAGSASLPTLDQPSRAAPTRSRAEIEAQIETLIEMLDRADGDDDLEPDDEDHGIDDVPHDAVDEGNDEPSITGWLSDKWGPDLEGDSWTEHSARHGMALQSGDHDEEATLGWTLSTRQEGRGWLRAENGDREAEHDGREPEAEFGIEDENHDDDTGLL